MKVLVTGNKSGLGRYLFENLGGAGLDRDTSSARKEEVMRGGADVIIHCAFNSSREIPSESLLAYVEDNVFLTRELVSIPHKKFIFISSVDVYPRNKVVHSEDEGIDANAVEGMYAITKLISESIVKKYCTNHLIVRNTAFLGPYSRKNSLLKIMEDENPVVTLTPDSEFNYVLYQDVLEFLKLVMREDVRGIYNVASSGNITLSTVAEMFSKKVTFGEYRYTVGNIDNTKAASLAPAFKKTSQEVIKEFANI